MGLRRGLGLALLSGFLLTLAFPRWNLWLLAWVALVPLFYALGQARNKKEAFLFGFTAGFVFFLLSIAWLRHVTVFGMFFVVAMEAVYWGVFGVLSFSTVGAGLRARPELGQPRGVAPTFVLAVSWVVLEFIRSEIPVWGFGWNLVGSSQASNLWTAQLASLGGVYSVSFVVFLGNAVIYSLGRGLFVGAGLRARPELGQPQGVAPTLGSAFLFLLLLVAILLFGWSRLETFVPNSFLRISVLQGNIPQMLKWEKGYRDEILKIYLNLTELAGYDAPQLIVWPEAAYPGFFNRETDAERVKELVRKIQIPLLVGSPHEGEDGFYNSAYLLAPSPPPSPPGRGRGKGEGERVRILQRYDKIQLVPFGEYVPWKPIFGFLEPYAYALGVSDFSSGRTLTVFDLPLTLPSPPEGERESLPAGKAGVRGVRFSTLICFEDTFPELARRFVDRGADFLTVITNDAWFGHSSAPYQHVQASVFRAIENGVPVVRAANTGVSGFITPRGQVVERVKNQEGKDTFIMGGMTYPIALAKETTLYRKGGWLFPWACLLALIGYGILMIVGAGPRARPELGQPQGVAPTLSIFILLILLSTGCIRLQGGAFYAKKGSEEGPTKVKEVYVDTDKFLPGKKEVPGKIEV